MGLREWWSRLVGGGSGEMAEAEAVEHAGYRIRPTPFTSGGHYQTCGVIEKEIAGELKTHRFIRAETHPSRDAAIEFAIDKGRQLIDEQGDRLFRS